MGELLFEAETYAIIGAAMAVHSELGPYYLEAVYHEAMEIEFDDSRIPYVSQPEMRILYRGRTLRKYYIPDFVVYGHVVVEIKAFAASLNDISEKQLLNSLKCSGNRAGLLINFGRKSLEHRRFVL